MAEQNTNMNVLEEIISTAKELDENGLMQLLTYIRGLNTGMMINQQDASA